jgi:TatD DNase family protein
MTCIDSHCHLAGDEFRADLADVARRALAAGVPRAVCIVSADEPREVQRALEVRVAWPAVVTAVGIHPHRAGAYADAALAQGATALEASCDVLSPVAIGEIGLDYHYDFAPRSVQREVFEMQLAAATARELPVAIHTREASDDTFEVLARFAGKRRGVMHCFTGSVEEARRALDLGFFLSLSGILTFPKADGLRAVAAFAPLDRLLVETDAPYLAPVPHRGQRNEPAWVVRTLETLAEVRRERLDALATAVRANTERCFGLGDGAPSR